VSWTGANAIRAALLAAKRGLRSEGRLQISIKSENGSNEEVIPTVVTARSGPTMGILNPVPFTPEKECYTVLILQLFRKANIKRRSVSDTFGTREAGEPLEELVEFQSLSVDLREAVMACLSRGECCCWTVGELVERFKNLGVCATRASVTAALAELGLELELSS
jgi:hypothetical protein